MAVRALVERLLSRLSSSRPDLHSVLGERGQSVLEFVFMLPVLLGLVVVMVRSNTVIQMSIVNQKYARAQALWLTFNSPYYPRLSFRKSTDKCNNFDPQDQFIANGYNRMVIGMAEKPVDEMDSKATASVQAITRGGVPAPDGPSQSEPIDRAKVRVRTTVALCTQTNAIITSQGICPVSAENISENTVFDFCRGQDK
jgi:hypothetical protein